MSFIDALTKVQCDQEEGVTLASRPMSSASTQSEAEPVTDEMDIQEGKRAPQQRKRRGRPKKRAITSRSDEDTDDRDDAECDDMLRVSDPVEEDSVVGGVTCIIISADPVCAIARHAQATSATSSRSGTVRHSGPSAAKL